LDNIDIDIDFLNFHFSFLEIDQWLCGKGIWYKNVETLANEIIILASCRIV